MNKLKQKEARRLNLKTKSLERFVKSLIPLNLKKFLLFFLVNSFVGKLLKSLKISWNLFGGKFNYSLVSDRDAAKIFWGIWESAEIRFSKRFVSTNTVIELGSSVGVTLGVLSNTRTSTKFICLEASSENFEKLSSLKKILSDSNEYILINKAIAYGAEKVNFNFTTATGSKISHESSISDSETSSYVDTITLSKVLTENEVNDEFTLITDIEGAEEDVFFKDDKALSKCVLIIAELENTSSHTVNDQILKLKNIGFNLTERYGSVVVMSR